MDLNNIPGNVVRVVHVESDINGTKKTEVFHNTELEKLIRERQELDNRIQQMMKDSYKAQNNTAEE